MALKRYSQEDIISEDRKLLAPGWYQLVVSKVEAKESKATQPMLSIQYRVCAEEGDPDSTTGSPVFDIVMFPEVGDEDVFRTSVAEKTGKEGEELDETIKTRMRMAQDGATNFAFAVFGYDHFSPVARKNKDSGQYELPDGSIIESYEERVALFNARKVEALNAAADVYEGNIDLTRYMVYGKIDARTYNGEEQNVVKSVKCFLPDGESLSFP